MRENDPKRGAPGTVGYDAAKRVKGRKRHVVVDSHGLPLAVVVTGAQVHDAALAGGGAVLRATRAAVDAAAARLGVRARLGVIWADGVYRGSARVVAQACRFDLRLVERPGDKAGRAPGFAHLSKRWVVERTFGWVLGCRRLEFDHEYKTANSEGMLWVRTLQLMLNRIWPRKTAS